MNLLSRNEEIILLTILKIGKDAYGVSIRDQIHKDTGIWWSFASIYQPLDKLKQKKYVVKVKGSSSPERGGKSKMMYAITREGKKALVTIQNVHNSFWSDAPEIVLD